MDYQQLKIKEFRFWDLYLHPNQSPYLGRCYAWARRESAITVLDMTGNEREELYEKVIPAWYKAVKKLSNPDNINIASLGNATKHLHYHLIPRFNTTRKFHNHEFKDPNPKGNYSPYDRKKLSLEFLLIVKNEIIQNIGINL